MHINPNLGFNLYEADAFLDPQTCAELMAQLRCASSAPAEVYGTGAGNVDDRIRKVSRLVPSAQTMTRLTEMLVDHRDDIGRHFGIKLTTCEEPQFLRYRVGDFFVAHQDGNTGLIYSQRERSRKISVIIFLNQQSDNPDSDSYSGGTLVFSNWKPDAVERNRKFHGKAGTLLAFQAETTHEVVAVTAGERYSIVSWYG